MFWFFRNRKFIICAITYFEQIIQNIEYDQANEVFVQGIQSRVNSCWYSHFSCTTFLCMWMYIITHEINMAWSQSYNMRNLLLQVRGILNKLTPEKFQKLSDDLLQTELNSGVILKGVILLVSRDSCSHLSVWCPIFTVVSVQYDAEKSIYSLKSSAKNM